MPKVHLLDYVAGNVRSLVNAIESLGYEVEWVRSPEEVATAQILVLPGVGHFGHCLSQLSSAGFLPHIRAHIEAGKPFMGICVGLQALFASSAEDPDVPGLGVIPVALERFDDADKAVPHIGWNNAIYTADPTKDGSLCGLRPSSRYYYVHSFRAPYTPGELEKQGWAVAAARHGGESFIGAVARGNILGTQFHPEKSGVAGLRVMRAFLDGSGAAALAHQPPWPNANIKHVLAKSGLTRRIIACLDVRTNDQGDLVVTKGDQYDVREKTDGHAVRDLGRPVDLARRYYEQGADEVAFLNITSFRCRTPLADAPLLEVLRRTSASVFVPLTIGGGIRDAVDADGTKVSALEIAAMYFRSGADKVSIGSDAVLAAEEYYINGESSGGADGPALFGNTAIEQISRAYGNQAVVVSVDPKRVYVPKRDATRHATIATKFPGPKGELFCWWACTIKGGRETRDLDVVELATAVEVMGAGEILLNSIDRDGTSAGFDLELIEQVKGAVRIPVIASSGAGRPEHFSDVFELTRTDAALGAGMFHRGDFSVQEVKDYLGDKGVMVRRFEGRL